MLGSGRLHIEWLADMARVSFQLKKPMGIPDEERVFEIRYGEVDNLAEAPKLVPHEWTIEVSFVSVDIQGQSVLFVYRRWQETSGPLMCNEEEVDGPYAGNRQYVTITFQRSRWAQHRVNLGTPPAEHPDPVISIPHRGELPLIAPGRQITTAEPRKDLVEETWEWWHWENEKVPTRPAVMMEWEESSVGSWESRMCLLLWIVERGEWIAITLCKWIEGGGLEDNNYAGPFELDGACVEQLRRAYQVPTGRTLTDVQIRFTSPEALEGLAGREKSCQEHDR